MASLWIAVENVNSAVSVLSVLLSRVLRPLVALVSEVRITRRLDLQFTDSIMWAMSIDLHLCLTKRDCVVQLEQGVQRTSIPNEGLHEAVCPDKLRIQSGPRNQHKPISPKAVVFKSLTRTSVQRNCSIAREPRYRLLGKVAGHIVT